MFTIKYGAPRSGVKTIENIQLKHNINKAARLLKSKQYYCFAAETGGWINYFTDGEENRNIISIFLPRVRLNFEKHKLFLLYLKKKIILVYIFSSFLYFCLYPVTYFIYYNYINI